MQDVLAALPTDNLTECYVQMADLAQQAPASVVKLASMLKPAEAGANNLVEYAIAVWYAMLQTLQMQRLKTL